MVPMYEHRSEIANDIIGDDEGMFHLTVGSLDTEELPLASVTSNTSSGMRLLGAA